MYSIIKYFKNFNLSKRLFLLIFIAFTFSVLARLFWVFWASEYPVFFWNDTLMINTNDGYAFAEGTRDMLAGFHQENDLSYYGSSLSTLTYVIVKFLNIKLEVAMLYMSVIFSSLIVVPILLIANEYKDLKTGFLAALLACIANSYYNRTMAGYYDTDMLNIVLPLFIIWGLIRVCERKNRVDLIIAPFFILIYNWWYNSGFTLVSATIGLFLLYTLVFERKNSLFYAQLILLLLAVANLNFYIKIFFIFAFYVVFFKDRIFENKKIIFLLLAISFILFSLCGGLNPIIFQAKFYLFRSVSEVAGLNFKFYNVNQTIHESSVVDFKTFCERISGHSATFMLSLIGLGVFAVKNKSFLISFAMLGLGFLALKGGLRFTIYAVPVMAIGFGFLVVYCLNLLNFKDKILFNISYAIIAILALIPIKSHIEDYTMPSVFYESEVRILDSLKHKAKRDDYVLTWWDYGYPVRYYSDVKTLIDGGKHLGKDNFAVSFALGQNQVSSANMARFEVEYTEKGFKEGFRDNLTKILQDQNLTDVNDFLHSLNDTNLTLPNKTRDIYYFLPDRMLNIFHTILQFSRLDLKNGSQWSKPIFSSSLVYDEDENFIHLQDKISISKDVKNIVINGNKFSINSFYQTRLNEKEKLEVDEFQYDETSPLFVIFMRDYGRFLILDENMLKSTFIQLFVLEKYDPNIFEPVILNSAAKVYKLKK